LCVFEPRHVDSRARLIDYWSPIRTSSDISTAVSGGCSVHDLVIDNATIIDGLGGPARPGALAVKDGRIAAIGSDLGDARERVDAAGLTLAPGIVDIHTHYDAQLTWDPYATPSTALGVTTVVIGNCGFTIAPCRRADRDLTLRNLTHVEGMSLDALRAGVRWEFESYPQFLDAMERRGVVPNVGSFVGHSSVRTYVLGADATKRAATVAEVAEMRGIVLEALRAGAIGFATSTLEQHNGENGVPMPSRLADATELLALTGALGEARRGVFMLTKGMTSTVPWLEEVAAKSGRPVMIAAMFVDPGDPTRVFKELSEIESARARGRELWAQVGCFPLGMEFTLRHPYPLEAFLAWRPAIQASTEADYCKVLADPSFRQKLKTEAGIPGVPNRFSNHTWPHLTVMDVTRPEHRALVGRTIADLAKERGRDPLDVFLDFGLDGELDAMFDCRLFNTDENEVRRLLRHPHAAVALSDAGAHLSFLCDAGFGLHLFGHWVRERGDLTLPEAVKRVTHDVAAAYRIKDRGRLTPGAWADLLLFDPRTVARGPKRRVHDLPTGASRLDTPGIGVHGVWVNGVRTADEGGVRADCGRPGRVLRDFAG
jgi:N-acyl-D-amino-acid deacylase